MRISSILILFLLLTNAPAIAQDSLHQPINDSTKLIKDSIYRGRLEKGAVIANQKLREKYKEQIASSKQSQLLANLRAVFQRTRDYLKRGVDTTRIERELNQTEQKIQTAGDGIFINQGTIQTARNISTSSILLTELADRNLIREKEINRYMADLDEFRRTIDSLASDSVLFFLPLDTTEVKDYLQRLVNFQKEIGGTDSLLNNTIRKMRALDNKAEILSGDIQSRIEDIESFHKGLSENTFSQELVFLWEKPENTRPLKEIITFSFEKAILVFNFYVKNHAGKIFFLLVIFIILASYLRSLRKNILSAMGNEEKLEKHLTLEHPVATAIVITISIGQFIFPSPPFAFYAGLWAISSFCLTAILWNFITVHWRKFWLLVIGHFLFACFFNIILQPSMPERWGMLLLGLTGLAGGLNFLLSKQRSELIEKKLVIFLWLFVIMEAVSILANILGAYNLSKSLLTSGYFNLVVGIELLWTITLLHELFKLSAEAYRSDRKKRYHLDFSRMESEVPRVLYYVLGLGWFILIGRNFYVYKQITDPIIEFFITDRTIGKYEFSLGNILLFIFIILLAGMVSKLVSYFADDATVTEDGKRKKIGSWMLLIRIAIITFGIFLAFAATGIAMDKVAIVFGALSVGIGFGLQNLVNNLVSGLIIAFEKPLNVGDVVEIGGRSGTMKSIGFRSSVITTFEGSEVVIPNGDLLNQHLVNWTLNTTSRRVEVLVGVDYGSDIPKTSKLIMDIMAEDRRILLYPVPLVLVNNFSASSIDLRILFWVDNRDNWIQVRSDVMTKVKAAFTENKIEIPYPQMVLHNPERPAPEEEDDKP
ncbi:MAG TPA: mechanosensitive ion channel domain-containing protein [Chitinophagaceae bacterium]|nr:mechanosensitive ion channel domain-containing protein [Chitinophagaceae bacterium]